MKPGFDAMLWLLIAGTASLIIWLLFTALGPATNPFASRFPRFDRSLSGVHRPSAKKATTSEICTSKGCTKTASYLKSAMDAKIDPCEDFYEFSCGGYIKNHPLPKGIPGISDGDEFMNRFQDKAIEHLLAVPHNDKSSIADKKVARFYKLCLEADRDGVKTIAPLIQETGGLPFHGNPRPELGKMIRLLRTKIFPLWNIESEKGHTTVRLETPQLQLPDRLKHMKEFLKAEAKLLARDMKTKVNERILNSQLDDHVNLLTAIEKVKSGNLLEISIKGRSANTYTFTLEQIEKTFPELPWRVITGSNDLSKVQYIGDLNYTRGIHELWKNGVLNEKNLKEWYVSEYVEKNLMLLGAEYRDLLEEKFGIKKDLESFCFKRVKDYMPRWLDAFFAEKVAKLKDYTELTKLSDNMKEAWLETMRENAWIEPATKENITRQMAGVNIRFGIIVPQYSQEKLDKLYGLFDPNDSPTFAEFLKNVPKSEIEKQFDDSFVKVLSYTVNAGNGVRDGKRNVVIYGGHIEEPFYADDYPLEYKYGSMGFTIGHELTHTFDPNGLNRSLLVGDDPQQYDKNVECIVNQFGNTTYPLQSFDDAYHYDGKRVQGETTADNTGLRSAFRAYRKERAHLYGDYPAKLPGLDEYTNDQLFFVSFARYWCMTQSEQDRLDWLGDTHPLHRTRVNEGVKNFEAFSEAFTCKPNSPMNPPKKCRIWRHRHRRQ